MVGLILALLVLIGAVVLSVRKGEERLHSLVPGALVALYLGIVEMRDAIAANGFAEHQGIDIATSVAFTAASALLIRLSIRRFRSARLPRPDPSR